MRIQAYLRESPIFTVKRAARLFDDLATRAFASDGLGLTEGLILAATFFEAPAPTRPSQLAETLGTTRGNISHAISSLEARGLVQRRIDPLDARGYQLTLKPLGKRSAVRVIGAFDKMQNSFEKQVGKTALANALALICIISGNKQIAPSHPRGKQ